MRPWSGMAAVALFAASFIVMGRGVTRTVEDTYQESSPAQTDGKADSKDDRQGSTKTSDSIPVVRLKLVIAGLTTQGCDVAIKPGNPSCKFKVSDEKGKAETFHVPPQGNVSLELRDVELRGADRVCTVAVTVRETGQPPKTIYRGFRLPARPQSTTSKTPASTPEFYCFLSSPSKLARSGETKERR